MPTTRTRTVKSSGGDYSSLSAWEAGEQANLVSLDEIRQAECYSMSDTTSVDISGWTTDTTRYIRVYTPTTARHSGVWNTSAYRLEHTGGGNALLVGQAYTRIEGIQIQSTNSTAVFSFLIRHSSSGELRVSDVILRAILSGSAVSYGYFNVGSGTGYVWNTLAYGFLNGTNACLGFYVATGTTYAYNCTVAKSYIGFANDATFVVKNCLAQVTSEGYEDFVSAFGGASTNNGSNIVSDAPGSNPRTGTVAFRNAGGDDFHLSGSDTVARGYGVDLSADATLSITDDIEGVTRSSWSIGAFAGVTVTVTKTVKSSGGDYSSLSAWEAGQQVDLVVYDQIRQAECYSMADTANVSIQGWTADATRYLRIYTPTSERHRGVWDDTRYRLDFASGAALYVESGVVKIEGLQVRITASSGTTQHCISAETPTLDVSDCILRLAISGTVAAARGLYLFDAGNSRIWNNVVYGDTLSAVTVGIITAVTSTSILYNNTVVRCGAGYSFTDASDGFKNNLAQLCTDGFALNSGGSATNCCSDIVSDAPGSNARTGTVTFIDAAGNDFHLAAADTVARGYGADLSADPALAFSDDIDGLARTGTWDIGADQLDGLYAYVDETVTDDTDRIRSSIGTASDPVTLAFGDIATPSAGTVSVIIRHRSGA